MHLVGLNYYNAECNRIETLSRPRVTCAYMSILLLYDIHDVEIINKVYFGLSFECNSVYTNMHIRE